MSKSIKLSPKHGVNPTIVTCFHCGRDTNEIALMGKLKGDIEAPRRTVLDYSICEQCQKEIESEYVMMTGITFEQPDDKRPPIQRDGDVEMYPTESIKLREAILDDLFTDKELVTLLKKKRHVLIDNRTIQDLKNWYHQNVSDNTD